MKETDDSPNANPIQKVIAQILVFKQNNTLSHDGVPIRKVERDLLNLLTERQLRRLSQDSITDLSQVELSEDQ